MQIDRKDIKILIVDNMTYIRILIEKALRDMHFSLIRHAENGEVALEVFKQFSPHIVILDLTLPKIDGLTLIHLFITMQSFTKIIVNGDTHNTEYYSRALEKGAIDFFIKPLQPRLFEQKVEQAYQELVQSLPESTLDEADIARKFNVDLNSKKYMQIFNFSQDTETIDLDELIQAIMSFQMYNYLHVVLNFGDVSKLNMKMDELMLLRETVEAERGKLFIVSSNDEFRKKLELTELSEYMVPSLAAVEERI